MCQWHMFSTDRSRAEMREHVVRSNLVSEGSKCLLTPTSLILISTVIIDNDKSHCKGDTRCGKDMQNCLGLPA